MERLPDFRDHGFDSKLAPLPESVLSEPSTKGARLINLLDAWLGEELQSMKVLDLGCGRGEIVADLRRRGIKAYGIEVDQRFVDKGAILESAYPDARPILSVVDEKGKSQFPTEYFDLVISNQVLEHVADLDGIAKEIARLLKPGGITCHQFPARWIPIEPHYHMPLVHWLPKNKIRRNAIRQLIRFGFAKQFFPKLTLDQRTSVIFKYSVHDTFYRPVSHIQRAFSHHGVTIDQKKGANIYARQRVKKLSKIPLVSKAIQHTRMTTIVGTRDLY